MRKQQKVRPLPPFLPPSLPPSLSVTTTLPDLTLSSLPPSLSPSLPLSRIGSGAQRRRARLPLRSDAVLSVRSHTLSSSLPPSLLESPNPPLTLSPSFPPSLHSELSPPRIVKNPDGSLNRAAMTQNQLAKERRELRQAQVSSLIDQIPKVCSSFPPSLPPSLLSLSVLSTGEEKA